MQKYLFYQSIKTIIELATTRFIGALHEIKYFNNLYDQQDYQTLQNAIDDICQDIKSQIFGEDQQIDRMKWIQQSRLADLRWLFSLKSIREKVFSRAKIEMKHINEEEAKRFM